MSSHKSSSNLVSKPDKSAIAIQSAWRGKRERKNFLRRTIATVEIQRIFRGFSTQRKITQQLESRREDLKAKSEQKKRLAILRQRETDFRILSQIDPDQYLQFEKLRKDKSAKVIQKAWIKKRVERNQLHLKSRVADLYKSSARNQQYGFKFGKIDENGKIRKSYEDFNKQHETISPKKIEVNPRIEALRKYLDDSFGLIEIDYDRKYGFDELSYEEKALGLSQLYSKMRAKGLQKIEEYESLHPNKRNRPDWKYREMVKQKQKLDVMLAEYDAYRPFSDNNKNERINTLMQCRHLLHDLQHRPSLEIASKVVSNATMDRKPMVITPRSKEDEELKQHHDTFQWLYHNPHYYIPNLDPSKPISQNISVNEAIEKHVKGSEQLKEKKWDTFLMPVSLSNNSDSNEPAVQEFAVSSLPEDSFNGYRDRPLSNIDFSRVNREDLEDSLKWVSYCTAPSPTLAKLKALKEKLAQHTSKDTNSTDQAAIPITPATPKAVKQSMTAPERLPADKEAEELKTKLLYGILYPESLLEKANKECEEEQAKINSFSKAIEDTIIGEIKASVFHKNVRNIRDESVQAQLNRIIRLQAVIRGFLARKRVEELRAARRFNLALQNFVYEVAQYESKDKRFKGFSNLKVDADTLLAFKDPKAAISTTKAPKLPTRGYNLTPVMPPMNSQFSSVQQRMLSSRDDTPKHTGYTPEQTPLSDDYKWNKYVPGSSVINASSLDSGDHLYSADPKTAGAPSPDVRNRLYSSSGSAQPTPRVDLKPIGAGASSKPVATPATDSKPVVSNAGAADATKPKVQFASPAADTPISQPRQEETPSTSGKSGGIAGSIRNLLFGKPKPAAEEKSAATPADHKDQKPSISPRPPTGNKPTVMSTPATGPGAISISTVTPSTRDKSGDILSPFTEMREPGEDGYISSPSPSHGHSLSRSLTESFGQVMDKDKKH